MKSIEDVLNAMAEHPSVRTHRGATKDEIRAALRIMSVKLPQSYTKFLLRYGWVDINGDVVYGLGPDAREAESVFEQSIVEHVRAVPPMDHCLVPLMADGAGNHECLDTDRATKDDAPVVLWRHDHPRGELQRPKLVSKSFTAWLARKVRESPGI